MKRSKPSPIRQQLARVKRGLRAEIAAGDDRVQNAVSKDMAEVQDTLEDHDTRLTQLADDVAFLKTLVQQQGPLNGKD